MSLLLIPCRLVLVQSHFLFVLSHDCALWDEPALYVGHLDVLCESLLWNLVLLLLTLFLLSEQVLIHWVPILLKENFVALVHDRLIDLIWIPVNLVLLLTQIDRRRAVIIFVFLLVLDDLETATLLRNAFYLFVIILIIKHTGTSHLVLLDLTDKLMKLPLWLLVYNLVVLLDLLIQIFHQWLLQLLVNFHAFGWIRAGFLADLVEVV